MNTLSAGVNSIAVARGAGRPYLTAAEAAARLLELPVQHTDSPDLSAISIGAPDFVKDCAGAAALIAGAPADKRWDLIYQTDEGGWLVTGATDFAAVHALLSLADWLRWAEPLPQPCRSLRTPVFHSMTMEFDDWSAGFARLADGFDMPRHVADAARVGIEALEINLLADAVPIQVRERRVYEDMYQWWCIYSPGLDQFFESDLTRGTYRRAMLQHNLDKLLATAELCRDWGIMPTFIAFEPRVWPERLYDKYPDLRGARVDCSDYSAEAEFAPDPNHPHVLEHYSEMMTQLMDAVPDLGLFSIWSQDSNAGFPWAQKLYPGPNGPREARKRPVEEGVVKLMTALRDAGRAINPNLELTICGSWFVGDEVPAIARALPDDIGMSFTTRPGAWERIETIRECGKEPQVQVEQLSNPWKPLGPILGVPAPWKVVEMLSNIRDEGRVEDLILRGGIQSEVLVPRFITNEVIRAFLIEGSALDVDGLVRRRAAAWTGSDAEAAALVDAWRLCDAAVRVAGIDSWTVNCVSGRTLWRRIVKPIVPNQALLTIEDTCYYRHLEFTVGHTDPAWVDHFYKGWGRMLTDAKAHAALTRYDRSILPVLHQAIARLDAVESLSETSRDVRDRIECFYRVFRTDRNLMEVQEAIHACLAEDREHPERSSHVRRIRERIEDELENVRAFIELIQTSPSTLIPTTSWEETTFIHRSPFDHLLKLKLDRMLRHLDDVPGPWFAELEQPGGWTSDQREQMPKA